MSEFKPRDIQKFKIHTIIHAYIVHIRSAVVKLMSQFAAAVVAK
jgi:hypothetical protein